MRDELARTLVRECRKDGSRQCRGLRCRGNGRCVCPCSLPGAAAAPGSGRPGQPRRAEVLGSAGCCPPRAGAGPAGRAGARQQVGPALGVVWWRIKPRLGLHRAREGSRQCRCLLSAPPLLSAPRLRLPCGLGGGRAGQKAASSALPTRLHGLRASRHGDLRTPG